MPIEIFFLFGLFTLVFGYVVGNFFPMLKNNPFAATDKENLVDDLLDLPDEDELLSIPTSISPSSDLLEVAQFWRGEEDKELIAQIDSKLVHQEDELSGDQHALLSLLLLDLGNWVGLEGRMQAMQAVQSEEQSEETQKEEKSSGFSPIDMLKNAVSADVFLPLADVSLADQIDPILQRMLTGSPLEDRGISLMDIEGRGMVVSVGLDLYDSVGEVPDEEIRAFIQKAVAEWEQRAARDDIR